RIVVLILDRRRNNARRWGIHERLDKDIGSEREYVIEVAAFGFDGRGILVTDIADRHGQTLIGRYACLARRLLQPTFLEHRIAINVSTRRPLPGPTETGQSLFQIEEKRIALLLAVVSNVDASFRLFRHDGANSVKTSGSDFLGVDTLPESAPHEQASQVLWS